MIENSLADRIYKMSERTGIDTIDIMNTYIMQESKLYSRNLHKRKGDIDWAKGFEDDALSIMERYVDIHYGGKEK